MAAVVRIVMEEVRPVLYEFDAQRIFWILRFRAALVIEQKLAADVCFYDGQQLLMNWDNSILPAAVLMPSTIVRSCKLIFSLRTVSISDTRQPV